MQFMDKTEFVKFYFPYVDKDEYAPKRFEDIYMSICEIISKFNAEEEITKKELSLLIESMSLKSLTSFYTIKKMMQYIFEAHRFNIKTSKNLRSIQYEDICLEEDFYRTYFSTEDEIYNTISVIAKLNRDADFQVQMVACGLIWFGFTNASIQKILIEDIDFKNKTVFNPASKERIIVSEILIKHIESLIRNRAIQSNYLICGRSGEITQESSIGKRIAFLNNYSDVSQKQFSVKNIYYSGLFDRVYKGDIEQSSLTKDKKIKYEAWLKSYRE